MNSKSYVIISAMVAALLALILSGLGLVIISSILLIEALKVDPPVDYYMEFRLISLVLLIIGLVLIIFGTVEALRVMTRIRKMLDIAIQSGTTNDEREIKNINPQRAGPTIIRSAMPESRPAVQSEKTKSKPKPTSSSKPQQAPLSKTKKTPSTGLSSVEPDITFEEAVQSITERYNGSEKVRKAFKGWYNTLMMTFPDVGRSFLYKINGDEGLEFSEGVDEDAAVQVTMDSLIHRQMMAKTINPIKAYSSGNLEVKGEMKNMLKLRKLMF